MRETSVTHLLHAARMGEAGAHEALRRLASSLLARHARHTPLQPTELVHEAYLKLVAVDDASFDSRQQFYALVACIMRGLLADLGRRRAAERNGGTFERIEVELEELVARADRGVELLDLAAAIEELARIDHDLARISELRYVAGLAVQEIATMLVLPVRTTERRLATATAWLRQRLDDDTP
jgi:RNA polymerase sigma factor (TIGR02999 family)